MLPKAHGLQSSVWWRASQLVMLGPQLVHNVAPLQVCKVVCKHAIRAPQVSLPRQNIKERVNHTVVVPPAPMSVAQPWAVGVLTPAAVP